MTTTVAPPHTHDELESVLEYDEADPGCPLCHTGMTRPCECGGRIHNELHGRIVEMCFACGDGSLGSG